MPTRPTPDDHQKNIPTAKLQQFVAQTPTVTQHCSMNLEFMSVISVVLKIINLIDRPLRIFTNNVGGCFEFNRLYNFLWRHLAKVRNTGNSNVLKIEYRLSNKEDKKNFDENIL